MKIIHITTGDPDGIGLEVSLKALQKIGPLKGTRFVLWRSAGATAGVTKDILKIADSRFKRVSLKEPTTEQSLKALLNQAHYPNQKLNKLRGKKPAPNKKSKNTSPLSITDLKENVLLDIACPSPPTSWVVKTAKHCLLNPNYTALVTGPLSKTQMQKEGFKEKGHTELLKKMAGDKHVYMTFMGEFFNVTLLTGHLPLKKVSLNPKGFAQSTTYKGAKPQAKNRNLSTINQKNLNQCIELCLKMKNTLSQKIDKPSGVSISHTANNKKIAVLGFNPHAGEKGLLGEEEFLLQKSLKKWKTQVEGPLVPSAG